MSKKHNKRQKILSKSQTNEIPLQNDIRMSNEELASAIQAGEIRYIEELYSNVERLLYMLADEFYRKHIILCIRQGITSEDLKQESFFAFMKAVKAYKPDLQTKFVSYLNYPLHNVLIAALGICSTKKLKDPLNWADSMDVPVAEETDISLIDTVVDEQAAEPFEKVENLDFHSDLHNVLEKSMSYLPDRMHQVLQKRYFEGKTCSVIAPEMGVSYQRISQIEKTALIKIKIGLGAAVLQPFVDEFINTNAFRGTGWCAFRDSGISSTERVALNAIDAEARLERYIQKIID